MAATLELLGAVLRAGFDETLSYLTLHVLTCLVPAFFIAGGISAVLSDRIVLQYMGPEAKRTHAYGLASVSGIALAVCSCTILPMFAGLYKKGAGIGPATAFLFSGPAINVLAIVFTARVLGLPLGAARAVFAVGMAVVIGLTMAVLFGGRTAEEETSATAMTDGGVVTEPNRPHWATAAFFASMVAILLVAASGQLGLPTKIAGLTPLFAVLGYVLWTQFSRPEITEWLQETWFFVRIIFPLLLVGTFVIGVIGAVAAIAQGLHPLETVTAGGQTFAAHQVAPGLLTRDVFGTTTLLSTGLGSVVGGILYMPTLLEVPIIGSLFGYTSGLMAEGPALALLLAGPSVSLPNMLVIWKTIGAKRTIGYLGLVVVGATLAGLAWGAIA
ncbi:MAG: permease [Halobacteriota archaeon]